MVAAAHHPEVRTRRHAPVPSDPFRSHSAPPVAALRHPLPSPAGQSRGRGHSTLLATTPERCPDEVSSYDGTQAAAPPGSPGVV